MNFKTFQSACKYMKYGCNECCGSNFYETCRRKDMIPKGHSWGICDEEHCPYFPEEVTNLIIAKVDSGQVLFAANEATIHKGVI